VPILKSRSRPDSLPAVFRSNLSDESLEKAKSRDGVYQLGTFGRGNHFAELQSDDEGRLWLMVHSGSRRLGQRISDFHLRLGLRSLSGLRLLDSNSEDGKAYIQDVEWARVYAREI
jgi:tRNA-splicing ligase RtcB